jgi:phosphatidylserine decarboxylase
VQPGDTFAAGERYGMIKFGSRTEVWVPKSLGVSWSVAVGARVTAGATVLGVVGALAGPPAAAEERGRAFP